ncbi:MAG: hypothetical protein K1060chlam5_00519 [Candidatus Anoxychlamydiales bacterium]|nr:hypothetical protein [Candidatus Anoxychlamydiales bacterium]
MFESLNNLNPLNFFDIDIPIYPFGNFSKLINKKYQLSNLSKYLNQEDIAEVYVAYSNKGLFFHFDVNESFVKSTYPEVKRGDSIELFIDTRNLKTKGYITKFCHHFVFFMQPVQKLKAKEITRFSANDMHPICDHNLLKNRSYIKKNTYSMDITIPNDCLYGYDINNFSKMGFTYRINRYLKSSVNFNISDIEHKLERSPHLYSTLNLIK